MMQVIVWLKSLANSSQKTWQARWNKDEHSECFILHVSDAVYCIQGETQMSMTGLESGYGAYVCYCCISKAREGVSGLKESKISPTLVIVFLSSCVFPLRGITMRWVYEKLSGFNTAILRHFVCQTG